MTKLGGIVVFVLVTLSAMTAIVTADENDQLQSGMKFLDDCTGRSRDGQAGQLFCLGYVSGIFSLANLFPEPTGICIPEAVTAGQAQKVVVKYLQDHPAELHQPRGFLTWWAMRDAFPCARKQTSKKQ